MILGITGKRLSGKSTAAEYIRDKYGFRILDFTNDLLAPILRKQKKPVERRNLAGLAMEIRKREGGNDALISMLSRKILPGRNYAVVAIRFPEEVRYLRKRFGSRFVLIAVEASPQKRFRRIHNFREKEQLKTMEGFMGLEKLPTEKPINEAMKMADFSVRNEGTKRGLEREVERAMDRIMQKLKTSVSL